MSDKPKRRWYQFSLRMAFVAVALFGTAFGSYRWVCAIARRNESLLSGLQGRGGDLLYDYEFATDKYDNDARGNRRRWTIPCFGGDPFAKVVVLQVPRQPQAEDFELLAGFPHLFRLICDDVPVTDEQLAKCLQNRNLRDVSLNDTLITDETLKRLADLPELRMLWIRNTATSDAGLKHLTRCPHVEVIDAMGTKITGQGVATFKTSLPCCLVIK